MKQEELLKELVAKLPAEIVEKINAKTLTEDDVKQYLLPVLEQFKDQFEGFAPLSDEQLEAVNGSGISDLFKIKTYKCLFNNAVNRDIDGIIGCFDGDDQKAKILTGGRQEAKVR